jgi:hypothetical protein
VKKGNTVHSHKLMLGRAERKPFRTNCPTNRALDPQSCAKIVPRERNHNPAMFLRFVVADIDGDSERELGVLRVMGFLFAC